MRRTINNSSEFIAYQEEMFAKGFKWNSGKAEIKPCISNKYPFDMVIVNEDRFMITSTSRHSPSPRTDIAETISNEAVYLEALDNIREVIRLTARGVNVADGEGKQLAEFSDGFMQIRNILDTALQVCAPSSTGELDRTQEAAEREMSLTPQVIGSNPLA